MGGSKSTARSTIKNRNDTLIVNRSDINILNKQLNDLSVSVSVANAKKCSASSTLVNSINFSGMEVAGDLLIGVTKEGKAAPVKLSQKNAVTFSCIQKSAVRNDVGNKMISSMMERLKTSASADVLNKMESMAKTKAKQGSLSFGSSSSSESNVENITNYKSVTDTRKNLENVVKNSVENNFSSKDVQKCVSQVNLKQGLDLSGTKVGKSLVLGNFTSDQASTLYAQCVQESNVGNKVINDVAKNLGVVIQEDVKTKSVTESKSTAESTAETTGLVQDMGGAVSGIIGAVGNIFGIGLLGTMAPIIIPASSLFLCCCCILIIIMLMK